MKDRYKKTKIASILGIFGNIFLLIIKLIASIVSNSQAMIADTINSAGDIFSSLMTYIGNKIASKPRDKEHNFGHGKAEYIFSMLISITIVIITIKLFYDSLLSLIQKTDSSFSIISVIVCFTTIIVKFLLFIYTNTISKKYNNILLEANSYDHRNDCVVTSFTFLATILKYFNIEIIDGIVGMGISIWIFITGIKLFKESFDVLMDKAIDTHSYKDVIDIIKKHPEIKKIQHFNSSPVGYKYQVSFTIFVDGNLSTFESHKIADDLEKDIINNLDEIYLVVIHVNPY